MPDHTDELYDWVSDGAFAASLRGSDPTSPMNSPTEAGQENRTRWHAKVPLPVFHSYQGASWIALFTLLLSWVLSYQTFVALGQNTFGNGTSDWGFFQGVSAWFADTMEDLWTAQALDQLIPYLVFSIAAVWLLDRKSRMGLRIGLITVSAYLGGTWYEQNYSWYPGWAAWYGDWTAVQLVALFSAAAYGILVLIRMGNPKNSPWWHVALAVLPTSMIMYGLLMTSTNAAF